MTVGRAGWIYPGRYHSIAKRQRQQLRAFAKMFYFRASERKRQLSRLVIEMQKRDLENDEIAEIAASIFGRE